MPTSYGEKIIHVYFCCYGRQRWILAKTTRKFHHFPASQRKKTLNPVFTLLILVPQVLLGLLNCQIFRVIVIQVYVVLRKGIPNLMFRKATLHMRTSSQTVKMISTVRTVKSQTVSWVKQVPLQRLIFGQKTWKMLKSHTLVRTMGQFTCYAWMTLLFSYLIFFLNTFVDHIVDQTNSNAQQSEANPRYWEQVSTCKYICINLFLKL